VVAVLAVLDTTLFPQNEWQRDDLYYDCFELKDTSRRKDKGKGGGVSLYQM
jgi:hypothetical protein